MTLGRLPDGFGTGDRLALLARGFPVPPVPVAAWADEADRHTRQWVRDLRMVQSETARRHFDSIRVARLAGRVHHYAGPGLEGLLTDFTSCLFLFDDQCDDGAFGRDPRAVSAAVRTMRGALRSAPEEQPNPIAAGLADYCRRLRRVAPPAWWLRFREHVEDYLHACHWEACNRAAGRVPTLAEYPARRRSAGAIIPSFDVIELAEDRYLPPAVYADAAYQEARAAAGDVICWTDDLATVGKEWARGDVHNLVIVLAAYGKPDWDSAWRAGLEMLTGRLRTYFAAERDLLDRYGEAARPNLDGLRAWMRGHLDWGLETARYRDIDRADGTPDYVEDLFEQAAGSASR
jgi:hypothetical protein